MLKSLYLQLLRHLIPPAVVKKSIPPLRVAYIISFADNDAGLICRLAEYYGSGFLLCYTPAMGTAVAAIEAKLPEGQSLNKAVYTPKGLLLGQTLRQLKQAQVILVDNYFPELAVLSAPQRSIIQLWHATGAIKEFGWGDPKTAQRSQGDQRRFQQVYDSFTHVVVGSEAMATVFKECYRLKDNVICRIGAPRTDAFQPAVIAENSSQMTPVNSASARKRILYVPTYRDTIEEMSTVLNEAFAVFAQEAKHLDFLVKLHPHAADKITMPQADNIHTATGTLEQLMADCDGLITDYSSCVFDFMLIQPAQPYLFFCPDLAHYQATTGLQGNFLIQMKPRIASSAADLAMLLQTIDAETGEHLKTATTSGETTIATAASKSDSVSEIFDADQVRTTWHQYNDGQAVNRLLSLVAQLLNRQ
ncbi:CDP-glycerol glycerophosphotransferase family protein [Candidatus Enterococcus leclercqii]|uniref:CDP-glycerol glycerophosphotransferase family protein n=1 Tax=Candidatus Enterococcus leclercqii TaxID=1857218 RepID=UPI00137B51AD|nr:CDP-glycerol glycerophosphotransferase family protein [Enterococcus sp. CU9D]KAF1293083.1 hypothetical protein BAU14_09815 [Enterococcus sp. CU9D]